MILFKWIRLLCLIILLNTVYLNGIKVGAEELNLFTCDENESKKIADGLILKLSSLETNNNAVLKDQLIAKKELDNWFEVNLLENDTDLDNEYKFLVIELIKSSKN